MAGMLGLPWALQVSIGVAWLSVASSLQDFPLSCCPQLRNLTLMAQLQPQAAMLEVKNSPLFVERSPLDSPEVNAETQSGALPVVLLHGLADSCFSGFMRSLTTGAAQKLGVYAVCIPTAGNIVQDFLNTFVMSLDTSVKIIADRIRKDPQLRHGFNLIALSQGALLARAYIQRYPHGVNAFLSIHGIVTGVAGLPVCFQQGQPVGMLCRAVDEILGDVAYLRFIQGSIFPANDYRDPMMTRTNAYLEHSQLADLNNERSINATYVSNFARVRAFVMVKAEQDQIVYPNEVQWWGQMQDGGWANILPMKATAVYRDDLYGLRSADEQGKIFFERTPGRHCQFSAAEYYGWLGKYFASASISRIRFSV